MTSDEQKKLKDLMLEYCASLVRVEDQQAIMKVIVARVKPEIGIEPNHFKAIVRAYHRDEMFKKRDDVRTQFDLFNLMINDG
jgi:hypothetical protein